MPRLCLNMIVKDERANLPRCLNSTAGHVTAAVIYDTGSTDGTQEFCRQFFAERKIPCNVIPGKFENFEQARNAALMYGQTTFRNKWDYLLLMDADMELVVEKPLPVLTAESYAVVQRQGGMTYHNVRLLRKGSPARYHGVTHEYLSISEQQLLPDDVIWFADHATGSTRGEKYARDTRLLEGYLAEHPNDARSLFYLAQTQRDRGHHKQAIETYIKRIAVGGWDEEVWYARLQVARSYRALGYEGEFVLKALEAYNARPSRAEPLYDLARHYREQKDQQHVGWLFANMGAKIPYPGDLLFVEQWIYDWGFVEEQSILGAYNDKTKVMGYAAADKLSLMKEAPEGVREQARRNLYWYLRPLKELAPSFKAVRIPDVNPDKTYVNSNPSVAIASDGLMAVVRTVSYRIRPDGTYDYNGLVSIRTTNYLCRFDPKNLSLSESVELQRPTGLPPPVSTEVLDMEDMRLIPHGGRVYANTCMLEQNTEWWREQYFVEVNPATGETTNPRRIDPQEWPKRHEKNWMPILGEKAFMYRPGVVIDWNGAVVKSHAPTLATDQFSGGGQVVPLDDGWVAIVHEARPDPTNGKRFYQHRFVWFDETFALQKVSRPFVFFDKQIEFAAGLAFVCNDRPVANQFIVSFGVLDREAWIATVAEHEVRSLIWQA